MIDYFNDTLEPICGEPSMIPQRPNGTTAHRLSSFRSRLLVLGLLLALFAGLSGCGLEVLLLSVPTGGEHKAPEPKIVTKLEGKADGMSNASVSIKAGSTTLLQGMTDSSGSFSLELPAGTDFSNLVIEVQQGAAVLLAMVPWVPQEKTTDAGTIDTKSTTITLLLTAGLSVKGLQTINTPRQAMEVALTKTKDGLNTNAAYKTVLNMVTKLHEAALKSSNDVALFRIPTYRPASDSKTPPTAEASALQLDALGNSADYCAKDTIDGCADGAETTSAPFDLALGTAIQSFALPSCTYTKNLQVVITATISETAKDGNCAAIKQFKHAKRYGGTSCAKCSVYFTGGLHKDSGITGDEAAKAAQSLSNWEPNKLQMYDDGTHGDLVAGDGIWTITFSLPAPESTGKTCTQSADCDGKNSCIQGTCHRVFRIGYKYTFGQSGDVWGGTEEFPGNQRLLEVVDQNGDGIVARHDNFADETANKDKVNTLQKKGATGLICFREPPATACASPVPSKNDADCGCKIDQDGDGIPDARERPWDIDNDCKADGFRVYANVQPNVVSCK
jgi:hypothetical protein